MQQRGIAFTHIYSSSLRRARLTADAILDAQNGEESCAAARPERIALEILNEQDFGSLECQPWASKPSVRSANGRLVDPSHPGFKPKETHESMAARMDTFLNEIVHPILAAESGSECAIALVSHGIILSFLWKALLQRIGSRSVSFAAEVSISTGNRPLEYLPTWSNTGYLEVEIKPAPGRHDSDPYRSADTDLQKPVLSDYQMLIKAVNDKDHLNSLKRTRGGLGSTPLDARQRKLDGFFKKTKIDEENQKPG